MGKFGRFTSKMVTGVILPSYRDYVKKKRQREIEWADLTFKERFQKRREQKKEDKRQRQKERYNTAVRVFYGESVYECLLDWQKYCDELRQYEPKSEQTKEKLKQFEQKIKRYQEQDLRF